MGIDMEQLSEKIKSKKKLIIWVAVIITIIILFNFLRARVRSNIQSVMDNINISTTEKVGIRDIETILSSSGTLSPLNTYEVTTLVEGEVIAADFEEGDYVEKGQVLYQIATETLDNLIEKSETSVTRAERNYDKAVNRYEDAKVDYEEALADYNKALNEQGDSRIKCNEAGVVKSLFVKKGDKIQVGSQIAEIYDNSTMLLEIPFSFADVNQSLVGKKAEVTINDSFETISGKVTKVSSGNEVLTGNRIVSMVTISVENPGGLSASTTGTARIGDIYSSGEGNFKPITETVITADRAGEIESISIDEGSKLNIGETILTLTSESVEEQLEVYKSKLDSADDMLTSAKDNMDSAMDQIEDAKASLDETIEDRTDYSITAPISGKLIRKDALVGDTIMAKSNLCVIYDLSAAVFDMFIDELDVLNVKVGQEVKITADALEDTIFKGVVTNVSLLSSTSGGVTQYPVTVRIDETGDLLPGMNITGEIIVDRVGGVIAVPTEALMRGDVVYVVDDTVTEAIGDVPAGFRSVPVETGLTDGDYIEIKSGLNGDEEVYVERNTGTGFEFFQFGGPVQGGFSEGQAHQNEVRTEIRTGPDSMR
ncbi:MAG TPA: HlyD family efflux transporter periplasmic adaptor subunit [Clostridiales bacterium]|nr:HlyD family efflux transporter periplasmic adaptor subunit [Clostridiales bacterium]